MPPRAPETSRCPIAVALDVFGDRWTLLVIRDLLFKGKRHYREFLESHEGIATNILADRLARLEAEGLVSKTLDPHHGRRRVYALTRKGYDLIPVILEMIEWSARHYPQGGSGALVVGAPADLRQRLRGDRAGLIAEIEDRANTVARGKGP
ncbi:MAG: winged helix-turn-helix transcriptional regulator [Vicinamibacterales bacterium]